MTYATSADRRSACSYVRGLILVLCATIAPDADVAVFITNTGGDVGGVSFRGLEIAPVSFIE